MVSVIIRAQRHYANVWARVSGNGQVVLPAPQCLFLEASCQDVRRTEQLWGEIDRDKTEAVCTGQSQVSLGGGH